MLKEFEEREERGAKEDNFVNGDFEIWLRDTLVEHGQQLSSISTALPAIRNELDQHDKDIRSIRSERASEKGFMRAVVVISGLLWAILTFAVTFEMMARGNR